MKYLLQFLTLLVFFTVYVPAVIAAPAPVSNTGQKTSYANGDDGYLQPDIAWPLSRFTDNYDGTVTDSLTGLIWLKNADCFGAQNWNNSLGSVNTLADGACGLTDGSKKGDWHLPNRNDLWSLVDYGRYAPSLSSGHPFIGSQPGNYWTSSTYAGETGKAWQVNIMNGLVGTDYKVSETYSWPVRTGRSLTFDTLSLIFSGNGEGVVNGDVSCKSGTNCPAQSFVRNTTVNLYATPDAISNFTGWSGACTDKSTNSNCSFVLIGSKSVTATFTAAPKAKIGSTGYASFAEAYAAVSNSATTIMLLEDILPISTVINKPLTLEGGYLPNFNRSTSGYTSLQGSLIISLGSLVIDRIAVR